MNTDVNSSAMKFIFITLFPQLIKNYITQSIFGRAVKDNIVEVQIVNIRDFATNTYKTCDDTPYGGGSGMVLLPEPLHKAIISVKNRQSCVVFPTPVAPLLKQEHVINLSKKKELIFICGRYEGIDERIIDIHVDLQYSVGEYIVSSGELSSLVIADATHRLLDGVINKTSLEEESFQDNLLEYPHYTRPVCFNGHEVPPVLLSGNHKEIKKWRHKERLKRTKKHRPDL